MEISGEKEDKMKVSVTSTVVQKVLEKSDKHEGPTRASWGSSWEFTFMCIGFSVGLGNVWRFPYLCYKNGGGAFLVPYVILLMVIGIPMLFMEYSIGQYFGAGGLQIFGRICPLFKGMGVALGVMNAIANVYYSIIISTSAFYLFNSFSITLPWSSCGNEWNTDLCDNSVTGTIGDRNSTSHPQLNNLIGMMMDPLSNTVNQSKSAAEEFFYNNFLGMGPEHNIENLGYIRWKHFGCIVFSWVCIFMFLCKGIKSSGKVAMVAATYPYVMLTVLVIRGVTLAGSFDGILYFITPQWSKMLDPQIWFAAATQLFFATNLGWGGMISMASYNPFHYPLRRDAIVINVLNFFTSIYAGIAVFSVIGFMAHETGRDIVDVITSGPGLVFIIYPRAICLMKFAPLLSILFFFMIFLLGIDSSMVSVETVVAGLCDQFPILQKYHFLTLAAFCIWATVSALPMVTQGGMYALQLLDQFAVGLNIFVFAISQLLLVHWIYGTSRLATNIKQMLGYLPGMAWRICWKFMSPLFISAVFLGSLVKYKRISYGYNYNYIYPIWAELVGWCIASSTVLPLLGTIWYVYYKTDGTTVWQKFRIASKPLYGIDENEAMVVVFDVAQHAGAKEDANQKSAVKASLDCLTMVIRRKLFTDARDKAALVLLGSPTNRTSIDVPEGDVTYPNVILASPMGYVTDELLEFVRSHVRRNKNKVGDLADAMTLAIDHLASTMYGVRGFTRRRLILFSDKARHFDEDRYTTILEKMIKTNIIFDVIHPPEDAGSDGRNVMDDAKDNAETMMKMLLMEVAGQLTTLRKTVPALRYFTHADSKSVSWRCHLEITESLLIETCCYTKLGAKPDSKLALAQESEASPPEPAGDKDDDEKEADASAGKMPAGNRRTSFSTENVGDMMSLTSHCFQTLAFMNCDKLNRDEFRSKSPLLVFANKSQKSCSLGYSILVNAMYDTDNALIVRRLYTNESPPTIGCLVAHVTNKSECFVYNELPYTDDSLVFTINSFAKSRPGSFLGRKRTQIIPSAQELSLIAELTQSMNITSALKDEGGTISKDTQNRLKSNQYFNKLWQCLDKQSFNPDRPLPGMLSVLRNYADLPPETNVTMSTSRLHAPQEIPLMKRLRSMSNKNQNATKLSTADLYRPSQCNLASDCELVEVTTEMNIR